ncbi:class A beta-lactamase [Pseudomonas sp. R5(2019)]|uniref:class A beta-lactamase n=1 Tax=Pseudomonas sp. R5(2019) TaxID=2697566 RepID=UPI001411F7E2|nr:class A beta-lactamase [Pseudomonas sp. R5(2019)]NBA93440.1 class A beta-lactamase [Pseudomonas sp. R5(2019)]
MDALYSINRRRFLLVAASLPLSIGSWATESIIDRVFISRCAALEKQLNGRLGVFALDTGNDTQLGYRATERFAVCSTFKMMLAAAVLKFSERKPGVLQQRLRYSKSELVSYSPVTERYIDEGMTVAELCAAAVQYSDNTAANLLIKLLGGPSAVTEFARSIGDQAFRLDRWETELNTAIPGDPRDTSTPAAMGRSLQRLVLGNALEPAQAAQLQAWLRGNTTGDERIRAGVPSGWQVGDKTGTGDYASASDIGVVWPPQRAPIVVAIYTTQPEKDAKPRNDIIAEAARVVADWVLG